MDTLFWELVPKRAASYKLSATQHSLWLTNSAIRCDIATGFEYIGKCPLLGISASSTPFAANAGRYDSEEFCPPYMNIRGNGSARNLDISSPLSDNSTIDSKIPRTAPGRTL